MPTVVPPKGMWFLVSRAAQSKCARTDLPKWQSSSRKSRQHVEIGSNIRPAIQVPHGDARHQAESYDGAHVIRLWGIAQRKRRPENHEPVRDHQRANPAMFEEQAIRDAEQHEPDRSEGQAGFS